MSDVRLTLPALAAWAVLAAAIALRAPLGWAALACFTIALGALGTARVRRFASVAVLAAVSAALAGLLLAGADARPEASLAGCTEFDIVAREHGTAPIDVDVADASCTDGFAVGPAVLVEAPDLRAAVGDRFTASCRSWQAPDGTWMLACTSAEQQGEAWWSAWTRGVRAAFHESTADLPGDGAALLPGLAIGDDSRVDEDVTAAMRASGLTHLTAVSGANCAIVIGCAWALGVLVGLGRRGRVVIAGGALAGFVVLVGPEPSVLRAGAMAAIALVGIARGAMRVGLSLLGFAVIAVLLWDPQLATSAGFALSVLATCGLIVHAMGLTTWLARFMPVGVAAVLAVPAVAQLWCLPVLVTLQPGVSLTAVPANVLAAPAAPVATVVGLVVCALSVVAPAVAAALAWVAWLPAAWIGIVARGGEVWPFTLAWPPGAAGAVGGACLVAAVLIGGLRNRPLRGVLAAVAIAAVWSASVTVPQLVLRTGIPNWRVAQCDVGQGSATLLREGGSVVLVDTGRDPALLDACLSLFGVGRVDVLVLTHFDVDHTGGADAVGGRVGAVLHGPPDAEAGGVLGMLQRSGASVSQAGAGGSFTMGALRIELLWPEDGIPPGNDASLVVLASWPDQRFLILGDLGANAQASLMREAPAVDVVVVAHHGSGDQHLPLYDRLDARVAIVPVGENTYGHPVAEFLGAVEAGGTAIVRTDERGAIAIAVDALWVARPP